MTDIHTREIIRTRAARLAPYLADYLQTQDSAAREESYGYKYCYLVLKGPKAYLSAFLHGELHIDEEAVETLFWSLRDELPGPSQGLLHAERQIINQHNREVDDWLKRNERPKPALVYSERRIAGLRQ